MALGLTLLILMLLPALTSACGRGPTPLPKALSSPAPTPTPVPLPASTATKERPAQPLPIATQAKEPTPRPTPTVAPRAERLPTATPIPTQFTIPATSSEGPALPEDAAILSLELASGQPAPGREFTLAVKLEPRGPGISGVQFRLHIPQNWVEVLDIIPATLLGPAPLDVKQRKEEPGGFLYAAARRGKTPQNTPPGQVAVVRMRVAEDAPPGIALRAWLREVLIADQHMLRIEDVAVGQPLELLVAAAP